MNNRGHWVLLPAAVLIAAALCLSACSAGGEGSGGGGEGGVATVTGTINLWGTRSGVTYVVTIYDNPTVTDLIAGTGGTCGVDAVSVDFEIENVPGGTWFIFAGVDQDGSGELDMSDWYGEIEDAVVPDEGAASFVIDVEPIAAVTAQ